MSTIKHIEQCHQLNTSSNVLLFTHIEQYVYHYTYRAMQHQLNTWINVSLHIWGSLCSIKQMEQSIINYIHIQVKLSSIKHIEQYILN